MLKNPTAKNQVFLISFIANKILKSRWYLFGNPAVMYSLHFLYYIIVELQSNVCYSRPLETYCTYIELRHLCNSYTGSLNTKFRNRTSERSKICSLDITGFESRLYFFYCCSLIRYITSVEIPITEWDKFNLIAHDSEYEKPKFINAQLVLLLLHR